jgi:hypothetical protein
MVGMAPDPNTRRLEDEARLAAYADELATRIEATLPGWVERCIRVRVAQSGIEPPPDLATRADAAAEQARIEVGGEVRRLLETDIDAQRTSPLAVLRTAVRFPTAVLRLAGVPEVVRDPDAERMFPGDAYDLAPASFTDIDPSLHDPGLEWGAAKAHVHLARRRDTGRL